MVLVLGAIAALPTGVRLRAGRAWQPLAGVDQASSASRSSTTSRGIPDIDQVLTRCRARGVLRTTASTRILPKATDVDGLLTGTIVSFTVQPSRTSITHRTRPRRYAVIRHVKVEFKDLKDINKVLWANPALQFTEPNTSTNSQLAADPTTFFRQDANALARLSRELRAVGRDVDLEVF